MLIKITPDIERAKSLMNMAEKREESLKELQRRINFPTIIAEMYYEIVKELVASLLFIDGFKAIGEYAHKEAIDYLSNYGFSHEDLSLLHDLRIRRNKSMYEGKQINPSYLENNEKSIVRLIRKLKTLLKFKIKESEK